LERPVLPIKRLCELAREREIITLVDGAQTFAQMPVFRDLGYDFFVTSLYKRLSAPIGNGMLIVKESQIDRTWPPHAPFDPPPHNVQAAARAY
jgi:selenocysteine lyase/cysteine desulfurase